MSRYRRNWYAFGIAMPNCAIGAPKEAVQNGPAHRKPSDRVAVRIDYHEVELREEVKAVGGI
ncbi:MAG: hypothetical protein MN733_16300 [Nitrososphaera sp.]|nr:hypothetical protein [Nitrososphaera sp.]